MLCARCHERDAPDWPGPERFEGFRNVDPGLGEALGNLFAVIPAGVCGECIKRDPELDRTVRERIRAVVDRINGLPLPRMAGEYLRRQVVRLLDMADGLVERFSR